MGGLRFLRVLVSVAVSLASASLLSAQSTVRVGSEFQVNVVTVGSQYLPDVSSDADGDFAVVWRSDRVLIRRFGPSGVPQSGEIQAEPSMGGQDPAVSSDAAGNFVVVWTNALGLGYGADIFGRRFNAAGVPQATAFQVNIFTTQYQTYPSVALDADGDFVVAWKSYLQDGGGYGIFARRFNSIGVAGPEFQVNSFTPTNQHNPSVGLEDNGDFVIAWQSDFQDGSEPAVFGQRYNALGLTLGVEFQINSYTSLFQDAPRLDMDADGDFVVVWRSTPQDGSLGGIFAQRFDSLGAKLGAELQVNAFFTGEQGRPAVALRDAGDFVVVWHSSLGDGSEYGVFGRHVSASGAPLAVEFQLSAFTVYGQYRPRIDFKAGGDFVVTWSSNSQDGSSTGIFAQRFRIPVPLDVDGNGITDPLSDGLLVLRYEFGFRGATLITAAVGAGCARCTAPEIEAYLAGMV